MRIIDKSQLKTVCVFVAQFFFYLEEDMDGELWWIQILNIEYLYTIIRCLENKCVGSQDPLDWQHPILTDLKHFLIWHFIPNYQVTSQP